MTDKTSSMSRAEHAYQQLMEGIRCGSLAPGSRIRETELAERLNISRTPVREALRRLESEGMISVAAHRGMIVSTLDYQEVMELYQMRAVLEATAAGLAAKHASEAEILALKELLNRQQSLIDDPEAQAEQNRGFHTCLYRAAHNRYLLKSLQGLRNAMALLDGTTYTVAGRAAIALKEHETIVEAIAAGDAEAAEGAARHHIRAAQQARIRLLNFLPSED